MEVLKEYLEKQIDGSYRLWQAKPTANYIDGWIEVPEGAEVYGKPTGSDCPYFHKVLDGQNWYYSSIIHQWSTSGHPVGAFDEILWQRPTHPEPLPFVDDEPPAYYGNAIRQKPRQRVYAVMGDDDCIWVPKLTADYLFNTVQTLGFVSDEQKGAVLYHLNYLKVYHA